MSLDGSAAKRDLDGKGFVTLNIEGTEIELGADDLLIETVQKEGFRAESANGVTVVLDTALTPELIREGFVRELTSKIQDMRKKAGFEVTDTIKLYCAGNDKIAEILESSKDAVSSDVLATEIIYAQGGSYSAELDINGEKVTVGVEKNS